jgi:hypothetical protein
MKKLIIFFLAVILLTGYTGSRLKQSVENVLKTNHSRIEVIK